MARIRSHIAPLVFSFLFVVMKSIVIIFNSFYLSFVHLVNIFGMLVPPTNIDFVAPIKYDWKQLQFNYVVFKKET